MRLEMILSKNEECQSFIITVNKATSRHNAIYVFSPRFQVYQCSISEKPKTIERPTASDALLKEIERILKKYSKGYKTEVECTVVGPTFNSYYHSKFKRFLINNSKKKEKDLFKILQKLNNKNQSRLSRQLRKEKELNPACLVPFVDKNFVKKINHELSKNPKTALDYNKNLSSEIASLLKYLCSQPSNDESKRIDNNITPNVPVTEDLNKITVEAKSANLKDNKNLINNEKYEENADCVDNQTNSNVNCITKKCLKNFRARLVSRKEKPNKTTTCICGKKNKTLRQKGTNTSLIKDLETVSPTTTSRLTNTYKKNKNKNKGTNTKTSGSNNNLTNLLPAPGGNCLLKNLDKNNSLNTYTKVEKLPKKLEFYNCLSNKDIFGRHDKCRLGRNFIKKNENTINLHDMCRKEKPKLVFFPFKKKCKSEIENYNEIVLEIFPPTRRNKIMFKTGKQSVIPVNNIKPIRCNSIKVQTDKKSLNCSRKCKNHTKNEKTAISATNYRDNRSICEEYGPNYGFLRKIRHVCKLFEIKKTPKRNLVNIKLSPLPSLSIEPNNSRKKTLFTHKSKGVKLTIGRVAEEIRRSLWRINPSTSLDSNDIKNEVDLTDNIIYLTGNVPGTLVDKNSIVCNLDTSNKIRFNNLVLKHRLPNSFPLVEPTKSYCLSTIYNISNKSFTRYVAPNCVEYVINTYDFTILKWENMLSGIHEDYPKQLSMQMLRSRHELKSKTNLWYLQENASHQTKCMGKMPPNTVLKDTTKINTKYYFEWLNIHEYNYLIRSSYDLLKTNSLIDNRFKLHREKQTESKFCLYMLQCHDDTDQENRMHRLTHPQSEHTCCIQDLCGITHKSNCDSCDIYSESLLQCTACTSIEEPNNNTKIRRQLTKKCTLKPIKCKKTITKDGSLCLTCDYNTNANRKRNAIWSKLNQKFTKKCNKIEMPQTELFLGIKSSENKESGEIEENELTFSDFERMSERQLRCIISQLSKAISPCMEDMSNNSDEMVDLSCCLEKNYLNYKRQGIKFFLQPNDLYSNKLFRFFLTKKTK